MPKWTCDACKEAFPLARRWVKTKNLGYQIIINWAATDQFIHSHMSMHDHDLIQGIEVWLDATT